MSHAFGRSFQRLRAALSLPPGAVIPVVSFTLRYPLRPLLCFGRRCQTGSLYYNGLVFVRLMLPFFVGVMIRWSGSTTRKAFIQAHVGWKLNGRLALSLRVQSDLDGAAGHSGANYGQAVGWQDGPK